MKMQRNYPSIAKGCTSEWSVRRGGRRNRSNRKRRNWTKSQGYCGFLDGNSGDHRIDIGFRRV